MNIQIHFLGRFRELDMSHNLPTLTVVRLYTCFESDSIFAIASLARGGMYPDECVLRGLNNLTDGCYD